MASAQVMPNSAVSSRKQEHLEAGKRRLEEFRSSRKKKVADRVKKGAPPDRVENDKHVSDGKISIDSAGAGTYGRIGDLISTSSVVAANDAENVHVNTHGSLVESRAYVSADPVVPKNESSFSSYVPPKFSEQIEHQSSNFSGSMHLMSNEFGQNKDGRNGTAFGEGRSWAMPLSNQYDNYGDSRIKGALSDQRVGANEISKGENSYGYDVDDVSSHRSSNLAQSNTDSTQPTIYSLPHASEFDRSAHENSDFNKRAVSDWRERNPIYDNLRSLHSVGVEESHTFSKDFKSGVSNSTNQASSQSATYETYPRKNRPSFLDALNIQRAPSTSVFSHSQPQSVHHDVAESASHHHLDQNGALESHLEDVNSQNNYSDNSYQENNLYMNHVEKNAGSLQQKPNEDFSALEQHIEDLTQEKFSLQRALEASKTLGESLAAENSSLTESYNQQGGIVAQLKSDIESLQAEISTLLAEQDSFRIQYMNAQLECNAADERAKLLASEVIGLEEKALRLRSNELKLGKELEKANAEIASYKKKMLRLEREQQDLKMTIDALQEEKKLMQSKLRKASASVHSIDNVERQSKQNVSTSTDDLEVVHGEQSSTSIAVERGPSASSSPDADNLQLLLQNGAFGFDSSTMIIPPDQVQMIQNISSILSELTVEKEELTQALVTQISTSSKLKDMNKELSQRLEAQTQRLELLTAQSMAKENVSVRQPSESQIVQENMAYADEGDEVVERVLGWIMKLFPGGPSRRRTSKLLD